MGPNVCNNYAFCSFDKLSITIKSKKKEEEEMLKRPTPTLLFYFINTSWVI